MVTFYFSYARSNQGPYLEKFAADLVGLLRDRTGRSEGDLVFIDREIAPGVDWTQQIREALRTCQVFFSVESPAYFQSEYCGKEWNTFHKRLDEYAQQAREPVAPLHFHVDWLPIPDRQLKRIPQAVRNIQDTPKALGGHAEKGFEYLLRRNLEGEYQEALTRLVDLAIDAWEKHSLPPASEILDLSVTESAFINPERVGSAYAEVGGVGHIRFGIVAGTREEYSFREPADSYGNESVDWKPFYPAAPQRIGPFAQSVAANLNRTSSFLRLGDSLAAQLFEAERARNIVVFLVDPWALVMDRYREPVLSYDTMHYLNCSLLIPWPSDSQTRERKAELSDRIRATLFRTAQREPQSYREGIDSSERLGSELIKAITRATASLVELMEVSRRVESASTIAIPRLSRPVGA